MRAYLRAREKTQSIQRSARSQSRLPVMHSEQNQASHSVRDANPLLQLQRQYGNRYVQRVLAAARRSNGGPEAVPRVDRVFQQGAMHHPDVQLKNRKSRSRDVYKIIFTRRRVRKLQKMLRETVSKLEDLEQAILLTSNERESLTLKLNKLIERIGVFGTRRKYTAKRYRYLKENRRRFIKIVEKRYNYSNLKKYLEKRKKAVGKGGKIASDLKVRPEVIRVHEGDAAHVSFNLKKPIKSGYVVVTESRSEGNTRILPLKRKKLGYNYVIWTGFWRPSSPASTGTYWISLDVQDQRGRSDSLWAPVRVENKAEDRSVGMVPNIKHMKFDGKQLVVEDAKGNTMTLEAISGIRTNHRLYQGCKRRHKSLYRGRKPDFTKAALQWAEDCGPLPEREYTINVSSVAPPETTKKGVLGFPRDSGGVASVQVWGPFRFMLLPNVVKENNKMRSGFYLHLDTKGDGTAGCIGVQPQDVGKLNMLFSLIRRMQGRVKTIKVTVKY